MSEYDDLVAFERGTRALGEIAGRLGWDRETVMPAAAGEQRAEEMAAIESVLHARRVDRRIGDWLASIDAGDLGEVERANLRIVRREFERTSRVPAELATEIARATSFAHDDWIRARAAEDFAEFKPALERVLRRKREEAAALGSDGEPYDALLDGYEPGATASGIAEMFVAMRPALVALVDRVLGASHQPKRLDHAFDEDVQVRLSREIAGTFGYDFSRGRIDRSVHPFSSGSGMDVRITIRSDPRDPFNSIYSTIHETGHGAYEQGVSERYLLTPIGQGASMGVHESQSRIYENQIGRSRAFTKYLFGRMLDMFGDFGVADAEAFYGTVNRVAPGYIRTEADELHYNLHIMMRFDLERDLVSGALEVSELPEAWNSRFQADFGISVDCPSNGVLQDIHWAAGLFGYFPTYTLGNVYAGCLYGVMRRELPGLDRQLSNGDTAPVTGWLRENLQRHGRLRGPVETVARTCGFTPTVEPLLDYLKDKFTDLYRL